MNEEEEKKESSGKGLKIGLIIVGVIALVQVVVLGVIFSDQIFNAFENFGTSYDEPKEVFTYALEPIQVNLASENSSGNHFLRTTIHFAYTNERKAEVFDDNLIRIQALVIEILRSQSLSDIDTVEKTQALGNEIQERVNDLIGYNLVTGIYFVEFIWQ